MIKNFLIHITVLLLITGITACNAQNSTKKTVRQPAVAGSFYPAGKQNLTTQLKSLFATEKASSEKNPAAIIVPHAGYIFSGQVAASAYAKINPDHNYNRIFVIGTSHHLYAEGASVYNQGNYKTPLGIVEVDTGFASQLIKKNKIFKYLPGAHSKEHSIEVQLPFLQYRLKHPFKIVPIIIGTRSPEKCSEIANILKPYFTPENLFVISSDFSHYPGYSDAQKTDRETAKAISNNSPEEFIKTITDNNLKKIPGLATNCCGWSSVLTLLNITSQEKGIEVKHIKYLNSGDSPYGDKKKVVGYHAFAFLREQKRNTEEFSLNQEDKQILLEIARESIEGIFKNNSVPEISTDELSHNIKTPCGAFVTLHKNDRLRGCIGQFMPEDPLYKVVQEMAVAAAFRDTRFNRVSKSELKDIEIEISVLTPLKTLKSIDDFELGKHGIYIFKGNRSGTYLPQVAESTQWTKEEFLGHCARDKAGIGWDGWKDADLYTYEALVFDETKLKIRKK